MGAKMAEQRSDPVFMEKVDAYLASDRNPFRSPEPRAKAIEALRRQGFRTLNGGNGTGATLPQKLLAEALGWPVEHVVRTGHRSPTHYKLDVANPAPMICVEVDGLSHRAKAVKTRDARKDAFLKSLGWTVLRFSNRRVLENLPGVIAEILNAQSSSTSRPVQGTTLRMAS
jgi:hypothetical protein